MFNLPYLRRALKVSKYSAVVLAVLFAGLIGSGLAAFDSVNFAGATAPALSVSCTGSPSTIQPGGTVTWRAFPAGGTGGYTFTWAGNGSFPSGITGNPIEHQYLGGAGTRNANVTVRDSSGATATAKCSIVVENPANPDGPDGCRALDFGQISRNNATRRATISINNPNAAGRDCTQAVGLASYETFVAWTGSNYNQFVGSQELFDNDSAQIASGQTATLTVSLPTCNYQVDAFYGTQPKQPPFYGSELIRFEVENNLRVCGDIPPPPSQPQLSCAANPASARINDPVAFTAQGGDDTFNWTVVGGSPDNGSGSVFNTRFGTTGTKTARVTSGGQTATCPVVIFDVPVQIPPLVCSPANQSVNVNQNATFVASGGSGGYTWSGGGSPATDSGATFRTAYGTSGPRTVIVRDSGGRTASCNVNVNQVQQQPPVCSPSSQSADAGDSVSFSATGGNGSFSWSANTGSPNSGSNPNFNTIFTSHGTHVVTVTSNGLSDSCTVVIQEEEDNELVCTPSRQDAEIGEFVDFRVTGGNGNYFWDADDGDARPDDGTGSRFETRFFDEGTHTVRVRDSAGRTDTCRVTVEEEDDDDLSCSPSSQRVDVNEDAEFRARGGTGDFEWDADDGSPRFGQGRTFETSFDEPGTYTVELESNGERDTCRVIVEDDFDGGSLFCSPSTQSANVNDFVTFSASGGSGSFSWNTSGDGSPTTGSGSSFGTRFFFPGTKIVTVRSDGRTSQCVVQIGGILGASTVITGPAETAAAAAGLGFLGALGAYGAVYRERTKKIFGKLRALARIR